MGAGSPALASTEGRARLARNGSAPILMLTRWQQDACLPEGPGMFPECSTGRVEYQEPAAVYRMRMPAAGGGGSSVSMAIVLR